MRLRAVVDTNVLVSHFILPHRNPSKILDLAVTGQIDLVLSPFILEELEEILRKKFGFDRDRTLSALESLRAVAEIIEPRHAVDVIREDESDNNILECALSGGTHVVVSGDKKHLLPLKEFKGIRILSPVEFLKEFVH
ncbi:MAG TPA: putative toxin-antitoxin system toxin component, PIN family [bacterium]